MSEGRVVSFNEYVQVRKMCVWSYAHRAARIGVWETEYLDRQRFRDRINRIGHTIELILAENHRSCVFIRLYQH